MITGDSSLAFFNFLINSRSLVICNTGVQAGLPPTIISPVAFQGASLRSLTVRKNVINFIVNCKRSLCIVHLATILMLSIGETKSSENL